MCEGICIFIWYRHRWYMYHTRLSSIDDANISSTNQHDKARSRNRGPHYGTSIYWLLATDWTALHFQGFYEWDKLGESIDIYQTMNIKTTVLRFNQSMGSKIIDTYCYNQSITLQLCVFKHNLKVTNKSENSPTPILCFLFNNMYQFVLNPTEL